LLNFPPQKYKKASSQAHRKISLGKIYSHRFARYLVFALTNESKLQRLSKSRKWMETKASLMVIFGEIRK